MKTPKYFAVRNDGSKEFSEYIEWLNNRTGSYWRLMNLEFYGIDGSNGNKSTAVDNFDSFKNNPIQLTLKEWRNQFITGIENIKIVTTTYITHLEVQTKYKDFKSMVSLQVMGDIEGSYKPDIEVMEMGNVTYREFQLKDIEFQKKRAAWLEIYGEDVDGIMCDKAVSLIEERIFQDWKYFVGK